MELSKNSIEGLANFVKEARENPIVESVYFTCFPERNVINIQVIAVYNQSLSYEELVKKQIGINDRIKLEELIRKHNNNSEVSNNELLIFNERDSGDHSITFMHSKEVYAAKDLVSGYILFDRFGKLEKLKDTLKRNQSVNPLVNSYVVEDQNYSQLLDYIGARCKSKDNE